MLDGWIHALWVGFALTTGLLLLLLAVCGGLVAAWLVRAYKHTRGADAEDVYTVSLPHAPRHSAVSVPLNPKGLRRQAGPAEWSGEESGYVQEELPF